MKVVTFRNFPNAYLIVVKIKGEANILTNSHCFIFHKIISFSRIPNKAKGLTEVLPILTLKVNKIYFCRL